MSTTSEIAPPDLEARQLQTQLAAARERILQDLVREECPAEEVNATFDQALERFQNARVRSFVPILVERAVRAKFGQEGAVAADVGA